MKNLSRKETCWAILQQVPTYLIAVLSLLICGFLTVASLFSLAVMRMDDPRSGRVAGTTCACRP